MAWTISLAAIEIPRFPRIVSSERRCHGSHELLTVRGALVLQHLGAQASTDLPA